MARPWNQVIGSLCSYPTLTRPPGYHTFRCENLSVDERNVSGHGPQFGNGGRMDLKAVSKPTASVTGKVAIN